jgi:hypothetical protein
MAKVRLATRWFWTNFRETKFYLSHSVFGWQVADDWCWFVLREEYCWLVGGGWFVLREKYCWLVADKPSEQAVSFSTYIFNWKKITLLQAKWFFRNQLVHISLSDGDYCSKIRTSQLSPPPSSLLPRPPRMKCITRLKIRHASGRFAMRDQPRRACSRPYRIFFLHTTDTSPPPSPPLLLRRRTSAADD